MKTTTLLLLCVLFGGASVHASDNAAANTGMKPDAAVQTASAAAMTGDLITDIAAAAVQDGNPQAQQSMMQSPQKKNPVLTGMMSLAIPGAGQIYTGNYTRAAIYVVAEAVALAAGIAYNNKGDRKTEEFEGYADAHWSVVKYVQFLKTYAGKYRSNKDNAKIEIDPNTSLKPWQRVDWNAINAYESEGWAFGFSHRLPRYGEQQYYELIGKYDQFKYGWDTYPVDANGLPVNDSGYYEDVPQQLKDYAAERGKANDFYTASRLAIGIVVVNHFLSAVDGYLAARHYNAELTSGMSMERMGDRVIAVPTVSLAIGF